MLGGLLLLGTVWEISTRKKDKTKQDQVAPLRLGEHRMLKYVKVEMCQDRFLKQSSIRQFWIVLNLF